MREIFLNEKEVRSHLFPFSVTRNVADIRVGILTIREKWARMGLPVRIFDEAVPVLNDSRIFAANIIPSKTFIESLGSQSYQTNTPDWKSVKILQFPWHIFIWNDWAIREDFTLLTYNRNTQPVPETVQVINANQVFIEKNAKLSYCTLNASGGPIYIGCNTEIMEGATIRGPFALCEGSIVKMGARIYGATTIGPYSIVGGEIKNSVIQGFSNKAHDGYLGDSVVGEWCNIGAGTSNSNLKNNAREVKVWNQATKAYVVAGLKCGLMMGDYSRCAINTSFNTGTVVGVCSNVFGEGLTPKFIPSFTWGIQGISSYTFEKAIEDIHNWKKLKGFEMSEEERIKLRTIFEEV